MGAEELQRFLKREQSELCSLTECQQLIETLTGSTHEVTVVFFLDSREPYELDVAPEKQSRRAMFVVVSGNHRETCFS